MDAFSFEILIGSRFLDYSHRVEILRLASTEEQLQAKALSQLKHPAVFLFRSHVSVHWQSHEAYICVPACILPIFPLLPPCLLGGCSAPITGRLFMRYPYGPWPPPIWPPKGNGGPVHGSPPFVHNDEMFFAKIIPNHIWTIWTVIWKKRSQHSSAHSLPLRCTYNYALAIIDTPYYKLPSL